MKSKLTRQERQFCCNYVSSGNSTQAAVLAGCKEDPETWGENLLCREDIADEIARLLVIRKKTVSSMAVTGYKKLAFGSIGDAVSLLYMENPDVEKLKNMDLYCVSEIRRPKEGAMEIKFFDRLEALEKLEAGSLEDNGAVSFFEALNRGASAVNNSGSRQERTEIEYGGD